MNTPAAAPLLAVAGLLAAALPTASAGIAFDLRLTDINDIAVLDPKNATVKVGDLLTLDLYVTITGAAGDPALEGFQSFYSGSILTPGGNLTADIVSRALVLPFADNGSSLGAIQDLDGDGDADLGSNATSVNPAFMAARASQVITGDPAGLGPSTFHLFTADLLIFPSPAPGAPIAGDIVFRLADFLIPLHTETMWQEDGVPKFSRGNGGVSFAAISQSAPIHLIPEPGAASLLLLGTGALAARRRRRVG